MPWPVKAASPCMGTGTTRPRSASPRWLCLARTMPSITGLTASRWLGFELQREMDVAPGARGVIARVAEVVLHVAVAGRLARQQAALELGEDHLVRLAQHVGEHVQPPAVRHADHDLLDAEIAAGLDERVQDRDEGVAALEREALRRRIADLEELLEALGRDELVEQSQPIRVREDRAG